MRATRKQVSSLLLVGAMSVSLAACQHSDHKKLLGGAALGGLVGSKFGDGRGQLLAVGLGTLIGARKAGKDDRSLDSADRAHLERITQETLETAPSGQEMTWHNPDSGNKGTVVAQPAYRGASGRYCREFQQTVVIDDEAHNAYGTACRQPDGNWKIVNQDDDDDDDDDDYDEDDA